MGQLENGLTYIIRHNEQPKERASFYIAQRVGSMQEEDNQAGLAHFLEHMAFNGTRHFPGKNLIAYLENIGVKFGANLNAYTSFDETMYTIMDAPVVRTGVVDSCLLILRDWSDGILLQDEEIDNERGVIEEEWRSRDGGSMRMVTELLQRAFPEGSRYGNRMPIGSMDVVRNFTYQELRDYYHKWYRPDLQGIIVVGDVDVDYVENKIKELFGDLPKPVGAAERVYEQVPDYEPLSIVITDPEGQGTSISFSYSWDAPSQEVKRSASGLVLNYMTTVISRMLNARFAEILQKPNAPFIQAGASYGSYMVALTEDALSFSAVAHEGKAEEALNVLVAEMLRAKKHGFTASEYDRVRTEILNQYDDALKEKANRKNSSYADAYGAFFTQGGYIPGIEMEHALINQIAPALPVEMITSSYQQMVEEGNFMIHLMGQEKEGVTYPTEEELLAAYNKALTQEVEPYVDAVSDEELIPESELPTPGHILSEEKDLAFGATLWNMSNGAKVYLLPTEHKKNDIRLLGLSHGGYAAYGDEVSSVDLRGLSLAGAGGLSKFDNVALQKVLTGRTAAASTSIGRFTEEVRGSSSDRDIETMFQLVYLNMTDLRKDQDAFDALVQRSQSAVKASKANPLYAVQAEHLPELLYPGSELHKPLTEEQFGQINYDRVLDIHKERFGDASDFVFFLVGSFQIEEVQPLVERYIGGLPALHRNDPYLVSQADRINISNTEKHITIPMDNPIALVVDVFVHDGKRTLEDELKMTFLHENLTQHYHESIREDEGGTYGVHVNGDINKYPEGETSILIMFQTNPESAARLNDKVKSELQQMVASGLNEDFFNKTMLNLEKKYEERLHENSYWMSQLTSLYFHGEDRHSNYLETLRSITLEDVNEYLRQLMSNYRYLELVAKGEATSAK